MFTCVATSIIHDKMQLEGRRKYILWNSRSATAAATSENHFLSSELKGQNFIQNLFSLSKPSFID